jgi:uncharacterized protein
MGKIREQLEMLSVLQEKDAVIDKLMDMEKTIPAQIEELKSAIETKKAQMSERKKVINDLQVKRKEKELDLDTKENEIKKHNLELNSIKTNEAYKALLAEIDNCKRQKGEVENQILDLMEKMEGESALQKEDDRTVKDFESKILTDIKKLEEDLKNTKAEKEKLEKERNEYAAQISKDFLSRYEFVRESKEGIGISTIEGDTCAGCHIILRPQIINDVCKEQEIVVCDTCSRILFKK